MIDNKIAFIYDLDGVIIDTIDSLYDSYLKFLSKYGIVGSKEEFNTLNGPKIEEIITYLKGKYNLEESEADLLERYNDLINSAYEKTKLNSGIEKSLKLLKLFDFDIALATSSSKERVEAILKKFNLAHYFKAVVTGSDVVEAKPSPLIYNLVKNKLPAKSYYVIEDSVKGVIAAKAAGMKVIFFNAYSSKINEEFDYQVSQTEELMKIITKIVLDIDIISLKEDLKLELVDQSITDSLETKEKVNKIWEEKKKDNPSLYEGIFLRCVDVKNNGSGIELLCLPTEYKYYLAKLNNPSLNLRISPIAVSGLITDEEGCILVGKRGKVTSYSGLYEFVPSGGLESIEFKKQIVKEFKEETGLDSELIEKIEVLGLIFDNSESLYEIAFNIHISGSLKLLLRDLKIGEYTEFKAIKISELHQFMNTYEFVPLSKLIYALKD